MGGLFQGCACVCRHILPWGGVGTCGGQQDVVVEMEGGGEEDFIAVGGEMVMEVVVCICMGMVVFYVYYFYIAVATRTGGGRAQRGADGCRGCRRCRRCCCFRFLRSIYCCDGFFALADTGSDEASVGGVGGCRSGKQGLLRGGTLQGTPLDHDTSLGHHRVCVSWSNPFLEDKGLNLQKCGEEIGKREKKRVVEGLATGVGGD